MRVSIRRFALAFSLPALAVSAPVFAQEGYYDDGQPPAAIALFTGVNFHGDVREAFDPFASMHDMAFNDRARSVAVLAGQWELCEHHNFTGRCVFIREDVSDLAWFGLDGRVSSIRPIFDYTEAQHGLMFNRDNNGYIRYAHNESWGSGSWNYGYSSSVRLSVQHYGYSPDYLRFGYYDPRWGFDPYGFAWRDYGGPRYVSYTYRVHPRPVIVNNYWKKHWGAGHKHWDRRGHRDDWRQRPGWRGDNGSHPGFGDRNRDRPGDGNWRRDDDRRRGGDWSRDRTRPGTDGPRAGRDGPPRIGQGPIPTDPRRGDDRGRGEWSRPPGVSTPIGTPPPSAGRPDRDRGPGGWRGGDRDSGPRAGTGGGRPGGEARPDRGTRPGMGSQPSTPPVITPPPGSGRPDGFRDRGQDQARGSDRAIREGGRREGSGRGDRLLGAQGGGAIPAVETPRRSGTEGRRGGDEARPVRPAPPPAARPSAPPTAVARPTPPPRVERERGGERRSDGGRGRDRFEQ